MEKVIFWVAFLFAYTMQAITGFAGNIFAMPVGTATIGMSTTICVLNICGFLACGMVALGNLKSVAWREFFKIISVMIVFMGVGIWLDTVLPLDILLKIYGVVVLAVGVKNFFFKTKRDLPEWLLWIVLAMAGLVQGMFVSGGAFLVIYVLQKIKEKDRFRVTLSLVWAVLNFLYAAVAYLQGNFTAEVTDVVFICVPLLIVATFLGSWIEKRISQEAFLEITYVLLMIIGFILIVS